MFLKKLVEEYILMCRRFFAIFPFGIGKAISFAMKESEIFKRLVNNPCEENAIEYIELRKTKPVFSFTPANHSAVWDSLREKWNIINNSDRISYEMKKAIKDDLASQGLYLGNQKIINNYKCDNSRNNR